MFSVRPVRRVGKASNANEAATDGDADRVANYSRRLWAFVDLVTETTAVPERQRAGGRNKSSAALQRKLLTPEAVHGYRTGGARLDVGTPVPPTLVLPVHARAS